MSRSMWAWSLWVHCIVCKFVKFHPLMLDSVWNTRDLFGFFSDPCVSIMFPFGASGFHWLCHVGFWETAENPWICTTYGVPQPSSEEEFSPIWANPLPNNGLVLTIMHRNIKWKRRNDVKGSGQHQRGGRRQTTSITYSRKDL